MVTEKEDDSGDGKKETLGQSLTIPAPAENPTVAAAKRNSLLTACGDHILPKSQLGILNVFSHRILLKVVEFFSSVYIIHPVNDKLYSHCFLGNMSFEFLIAD